MEQGCRQDWLQMGLVIDRIGVCLRDASRYMYRELQDASRYREPDFRLRSWGYVRTIHHGGGLRPKASDPNPNITLS